MLVVRLGESKEKLLALSPTSLFPIKSSLFLRAHEVADFIFHHRCRSNLLLQQLLVVSIDESLPSDPTRFLPLSKPDQERFERAFNKGIVQLHVLLRAVSHSTYILRVGQTCQHDGATGYTPGFSGN